MYGSAILIGHAIVRNSKNVAIAHGTHILRCASEQLRLATSEEKQLIQLMMTESRETELLNIKDALEGGTFRSAQCVDLLHEAYPPL